MRVTASIGLASLEGRSYRNWQGLIEAAGAYLYKAKEQGRNRTHYAGLEAAGRLTQTTISLTPEEYKAAEAELVAAEDQHVAGSEWPDPSVVALRSPP